MPDTRRTLSALQTLLADNTAGDISAQDARDVLVSEHPENVIQSAAYASFPSSPLTGDLFMPTNSFYVFRYNGSAWMPFGTIFPMTTPVDGDYAWINQGSATVTATNGGIFLTGPSLSGNTDCHVRKKAAPSTPYTITAEMLVTAPYAAIGYGGL